MAFADLYLERIDFQRYLTATICLQCGFSSCKAFIDAIKSGARKPSDCPFIGKNQAYALEAVDDIKESWPDVPLLMHPRPSFSGIMEVNRPNSDSLVLVSGNNEYTEQVLLTVLGTTISPFFVLFVDTDGNTIDMAMIYEKFTAERIHNALEITALEERSSLKEIIIPGLAAPLKDDIERLTKWRVRVGPVCAAEIPLFLSEIWMPPE